jgi:hypothetical protein
MLYRVGAMSYRERILMMNPAQIANGSPLSPARAADCAEVLL